MRSMFRALCVLSLLSVGACARNTPAASAASAELITPEQMLELAEELERRGDATRAQQYAAQALQGGVPAERVLPVLLRLCVADGQYRLAIDTAEEALRSRPHNAELRLLLATLYDAVGLEVSAIAAYERVLAQHPDDARAHFGLAVLLHASGQAAGADRHSRAYLALEPNGDNAEELRAFLLKELP